MLVCSWCYNKTPKIRSFITNKLLFLVLKTEFGIKSPAGCGSQVLRLAASFQEDASFLHPPEVRGAAFSLVEGKEEPKRGDAVKSS